MAQISKFYGGEEGLEDLRLMGQGRKETGSSEDHGLLRRRPSRGVASYESQGGTVVLLLE